MSANSRPFDIQALARAVPNCPEPIALYASLSEGGRREGTLLLESADTSATTGEKTLLVARSALRLVCRGLTVTVTPLSSNGRALLDWLATEPLRGASRREGESLVVSYPPPPKGDERARLTAPSPMDVPRALLSGLRLGDTEPLHTPMLVGTFAYDLLGVFESLPDAPADSLGWPDFELWLPDRQIWLDHRREQARILMFAAGGPDGERNYNDAADAVGRLAKLIAETPRHPAPLAAPLEAKAAPTSAGASAEPSAGASAAASGTASAAAATTSNSAGATASVDMDDARYADLVERLKTHIVAGDVFQIVPSRTFSIPCPDALGAYRALRAIEATPYMFFICGSAGVLFGASPETAVRVDGQPRRIEIRPIAGTRARARLPEGGIDADLDSRAEADLRLDEKEVAEHMMLVDLARNDAARVSEPGTRRVDRLLGVDRYAYVMHLVSHVSGELLRGLDALHAYVATMNMGTLVGAPKLEAARLLRRYERTRRGPYGGGVGYVTTDGRMDTAIVIRSAVVRDGVAYVRAGAGVVYDSVPRAEADETRRKADAILSAIARAGTGTGTGAGARAPKHGEGERA